MLGNQFGEATSEVLREWNLEVKFIWVPNSKICASSKHWSTTCIMKNCMNFREKFGTKIKLFIFFFCGFSPVPHILTLGIWKCLFLLQKIREVILRCISPKQRGDLPRLVLQLIHKNAFLKLVAGLPGPGTTCIPGLHGPRLPVFSPGESSTSFPCWNHICTAAQVTWGKSARVPQNKGKCWRNNGVSPRHPALDYCAHWRNRSGSDSTGEPWRCPDPPLLAGVLLRAQ